MGVLTVALVAAIVLVACGKEANPTAAEQTPSGVAQLEPAPAPSPSAASPSPSTSPKASKKASPKPTSTLKKQVTAGGDTGSGTAPTADGVPTKGAGTFTVAPGNTDVIGTGGVLVKYRVELEDGIDWGSNPKWTPTSFASTVDQVLAGNRSWIRSAESPITNAAEKMTDASWSFQRVSGGDYSVRVRLATPDTVDKQCGSVGVKTRGVYSCRFGQTIMINLRRWLRGAPNFPVDITSYRNNVINHEMGHFLGFDHMHCPAAGKPAPIMMQQTINIEGCLPNEFPFAADGTFISGAWAPS
jgi:hypothetical protein